SHPRLVLCATGAGGGSQQAMFRHRLDPLLQLAHERWRLDSDPSAAAATELERLFAEIQCEFEAMTGPDADHFQATAVASLIGGRGGAIGSVGLGRGWQLGEAAARIADDDALAARVGWPAQDVPSFADDVPGAYFGPPWGVMADR